MAQLTSARVSIDNKEIENYVNLNIIQDMYGLSNFEITYILESLEKPDEFIVERTKYFIGKTCTINSEHQEISGSESKEGFSFRGIVTEIQSNKSGLRSGDRITISGTSPDIILRGKPTCRSFKDQTLEQIVNEILQPYPRNLLNPNVAPRNNDQLTYLVQYMESDYDFLRRISKRYGEWFYYDGQELVFGELPDVEETKLTLGKDLDNFQFELRTGPSGNIMRYIHDSEKEVLDWESGSNSVDQQLNEYGRHAYTESNQLFPEKATRTFNHLNVDPSDYRTGLENAGNLEELGDALNLNQIRGTGTKMDLKIGQEVVVSNPGTGKSPQSYGRYRLTSLSHSCDQVLNYDNSFSAMSAESEIPENSDPDSIRRTGPIRGQVRDNADPDRYGRVLVDFGWVEGQDDTTPWIRVITPYVMNEGGSFFVPEIGSDVMVAFEDGDIERPYVMGAFNTSPNQFCPDPAWGDETPNIKAIRTVSGHTIEFHDVDGSEKIRIYDKDEVSEITFDTANNELKIFSTETLKIEAKEIEIIADQGIKIEAGQGMAIDAGQGLTIDAGQGIEVGASQAIEMSGLSITADAQSDVSISGTNVEIAANAQFKAAGNAGTEVSTPAILILKGSLVNIN